MFKFYTIIYIRPLFITEEVNSFNLRDESAVIKDESSQGFYVSNVSDNGFSIGLLKRNMRFESHYYIGSKKFAFVRVTCPDLAVVVMLCGIPLSSVSLITPKTRIKKRLKSKRNLERKIPKIIQTVIYLVLGKNHIQD